jgi:hypothetical protein
MRFVVLGMSLETKRTEYFAAGASYLTGDLFTFPTDAFLVTKHFQFARASGFLTLRNELAKWNKMLSYHRERAA